ncbi:hypothetical protein BSL78_23545 [Apostichopus japonicus]|uniref:Uncharacterized protein n=1 Tax=Stichopus japonicus TaxID=307972 RepID=A0A2G8JV51_STIJA|nr:hypothetical protein BSL78_23545 [Apostichopus japonicus]
MEPSPIPGPRGFPQGPRLPGPQHFPIPPQSPLPQGPMVPGMQQMHNPQQNSMVQVGVMPGGGNQVGNVMQMQQNAMQQRGMRPVMGNRMPGPPRMPNGVPRVRPPMISPNNHMQNPNFSIPEGFQRMPGCLGYHHIWQAIHTVIWGTPLSFRDLTRTTAAKNQPQTRKTLRNTRTG